MSGGDRGGVGALSALIRKTHVCPLRLNPTGSMTDIKLQVPIICIANDRGAQKLKPLLNCAFNLPFRKYVSWCILITHPLTLPQAGSSHDSVPNNDDPLQVSF